MKLLCEEVHSEIAMLAGLSGGGDSNNLARTTLENQEVTNADVVARNGDGIVRMAATLNITDRLMHTIADARWTTLAIFFLNDYLLALMLGREWVEDTVSGFLEAVTEGVVMTLVVVVSHSWSTFFLYNSFGFDSFLSGVVMVATAFEFDVVGWINASAVVTLSNVDFCFAVGSLDVNVGMAVCVVVCVSVARRRQSVCVHERYERVFKKTYRSLSTDTSVRSWWSRCSWW